MGSVGVVVGKGRCGGERDEGRVKGESDGVVRGEALSIKHLVTADGKKLATLESASICVPNVCSWRIRESALLDFRPDRRARGGVCDGAGLRAHISGHGSQEFSLLWCATERSMGRRVAGLDSRGIQCS